GDDDRVIDHDPKDDDEREERQQVDRASERGHEPDRAEKRYRESERHPERERRPEEERERHADADEPQAPGPDHEVEAALEDAGVVLPDRQRDSVRIAVARALEPCVDLARDVESALLADPKDADEDRGLPVEDRVLIGVLETVVDACDVAELEPRAVRPGEHGDPLEVLAAIALTFRPQEDLAAARLDGAARKIERRLPNLRRDLVEGQAIAAKRVLRDLDADLVRTRVPQRHVAYAGERRDLVPDLL